MCSPNFQNCRCEEIRLVNCTNHQANHNTFLLSFGRKSVRILILAIELRGCRGNRSCGKATLEPIKREACKGRGVFVLKCQACFLVDFQNIGKVSLAKVSRSIVLRILRSMEAFFTSRQTSNIKMSSTQRNTCKLQNFNSYLKVRKFFFPQPEVPCQPTLVRVGCLV